MSSSKWGSHIQKQRQSGMTVAQYCREQGLRENQFHYHRSKLQKGASGFVKVGSAEEVEVWVGGEIKIVVPLNGLKAILRILKDA